MNSSAFKNDLARQLFIKTADENYINARWCSENRLSQDFLWMSVHALEKYLKAVLLMNGKTTKGYSHNIIRLYRAIRGFAQPLLPDRLTKPDDLELHYWTDQSCEDFLKRLYRYGNADNRYAIYGYVTTSADLQMLDQMVFLIRRLACRLDDPILSQKQLERRPGKTVVRNRDILLRTPSYFEKMDMPLDKQIREGRDNPLRRAALNLNFSFAPPDYPHELVNETSSVSHPVIVRRILEPLESKNLQEVKLGVELAE